MKTTFKTLFIALIAFSFILTSCGKYEDGPGFSVRSKKSRLCGDWKIEKVMYNEADQTSSFTASAGANYRLDIEKDGKYRVTGNYQDTGTWELGEDKDDVFMKSDASGSTQESFRILRLKTKELWLKQTQSNGDVLEIHYTAE